MTVQLSGILLLTTAPAPIFTLLPIFIFPVTIAPVKMLTLSPMVGKP